MTDDRARRDEKFGLLLLFLVPAFFSCNQITARAAADVMPPVGLAFWRWTLTVLLLLPLAWPTLRREWPAVRAEWKSSLALGTLGMAICGAPVYLAAHTTTATNIGLIYAASPIVIVLLARLLYAERLDLRRAGGIAASLAGVLWIVLRGDFAALLRLDFVQGDLLLVLAMTSWAFYSVWLKHWPSRLDVTARLVVIATGGVVVLLPFYLLESAFVMPVPATWTSLGIVLLLAIVPGIGAFWSFAKATEILGVQRMVVSNYLPPIYNAVLAWAILGEALRSFHFVGAALILFGIWLATGRRAG